MIHLCANLAAWSLRTALMIGVLGLTPVWAGDMDDGISLDEPTTDSIDLDMNREFLVRNAKAKASAGSKDVVVTEGGVGNINIGVGADLEGATIINISDNEGAAAIDQ